MIYDNQTLEKLSLEQLKVHETKLILQLKIDIKYWLNSYKDNEDLTFRVSSDIECLKQVRKYIIKLL